MCESLQMPSPSIVFSILNIRNPRFHVCLSPPTLSMILGLPLRWRTIASPSGMKSVEVLEKVQLCNQQHSHWKVVIGRALMNVSRSMESDSEVWWPYPGLSTVDAEES